MEGVDRNTPCCMGMLAVTRPKPKFVFRCIAADLPTGDGRATAEGLRHAWAHPTSDSDHACSRMGAHFGAGLRSHQRRFTLTVVWFALVDVWNSMEVLVAL